MHSVEFLDLQSPRVIIFDGLKYLIHARKINKKCLLLVKIKNIRPNIFLAFVGFCSVVNRSLAHKNV